MLSGTTDRNLIFSHNFHRVMIDGNLRDIAEDIELDKNLKHDIFVVVDRIVVKKGIRSRLFDSFEAALRLAEGRVFVSGDSLKSSFDRSRSLVKVHRSNRHRVYPSDLKIA